LRRAKNKVSLTVVFRDVEWTPSFGFWFIFFGIDPKKKQKKSRSKDATSALFLHLEKLEKTSENFICFSTAPKFTPTLARLLPMATALYKAVFYVPSALLISGASSIYSSHNAKKRFIFKFLF
jgi:hypothetical protein